MLACFQAAYLFIRLPRGVCHKIPRVVRRELGWAVALLPLIRRNLAANWWPEVVVTDASPWGCGAVVAKKAAEAVREVGRFDE